MICIFRNHIISDCLTPGRDFNQTLAVFLLISPFHDTLVFFMKLLSSNCYEIIHPVARLSRIQLIQGHFGLTLHNHIHFISGRNGEL